jgi:hypothetical protein
LYGGTNINSGAGAIIVENLAGSTSTSIAAYGIDMRAITHPITITSAKTTGEAIRIVSEVKTTAEWSSPILIHNGSTTVRTTISATAGGEIFMQGTAAGTQAKTYSLDLSNVDILASSGKITLTGNRGVWWNRFDSGLSNVGALSGGSSTANILIEGNRFVNHGSWPLNFKTTGTLTIWPLSGSSFVDSPTNFPSSGVGVTDLSGLTVGRTGNTAALTVAAAATVAGPITYEGGAFTASAALTNTGPSPISILSSSTVALNANITSGAGGVLVKSTGRITTSAGTSAASPRQFATAGGPLTFWTTGTAAGVEFGNYAKLDTTLSGAEGSDITIGGGAASVSNASRPAGNSESTNNHAISIGNIHATSLFVARAGVGTFSMKGSYTGSTSGAHSGINMYSGFDILAGKVYLDGQTTSAVVGTAQAGINAYSSTTVKSFIEATSAGGPSNTLELRGSAAGDYGALLGGATATTDYLLLRASGDKAGVSVTGVTSKAGAVGLFFGATSRLD